MFSGDEKNDLERDNDEDIMDEDFFIYQLEKFIKIIVILSLDDKNVETHERIISYHNSFLAIKNIEDLLEIKNQMFHLQSLKAHPSKKDSYIVSHYRTIIKYINSIFKLNPNDKVSPFKISENNIDKTLIFAPINEFVEKDNFNEAIDYFSKHKINLFENIPVTYFFSCNKRYNNYLWQNLRYLFYCSEVFLCPYILSRYKVKNTTALEILNKKKDYSDQMRKNIKKLLIGEYENLEINNYILVHPYLEDVLFKNMRHSKMFMEAESFKKLLQNSTKLSDKNGKDFALDTVVSIRDKVHENFDKFSDSSNIEKAANFCEVIESVAQNVVDDFKDVDEKTVSLETLHGLMNESTEKLGNLIDKKENDESPDEIKPFMNAIREITKEEVKFDTKESAENYVKNLIQKAGVKGDVGVDTVLKLINKAIPSYCKL